jgi:hypothetical protein
MSEGNPTMKILSGWKEIACYLHRGVRTVQRWELLALPVHRVRANGTSSPVFAFAGELDAWHQAAPMRLLDTIDTLNAKVEYLEAEVSNLKREVKMWESQNRRRKVESNTRKVTGETRPLRSFPLGWGI